MESRVRYATRDDLVDCRRLFDLGATDHPRAYQDVDPEILEANVILGYVAVAEAGGRVVGMISAVPIPTKDQTKMLYMLVVEREYRGHKLAPELIRFAKGDGKAMAITVPHAQRSFEMAGMTQTAMVME